MKKIISLTLLVVLCLSLVACGGKKADSVSGIYTDGEQTFILYDADGGKAFCFRESDYEGGKYSAPSIADYTVDGDSITVGGKGYKLSELTKLNSVECPTEIGNSFGEGVAHFLSPASNDLLEGALRDTSTKALLITTGDEVILHNGCFKNQGGLAVIIAPGVDPNKLSVGKDLLKDTEGVTFFIPKELISTFRSHYNWSSFKDNMVAY